MFGLVGQCYSLTTYFQNACQCLIIQKFDPNDITTELVDFEVNVGDSIVAFMILDFISTHSKFQPGSSLVHISNYVTEKKIGSSTPNKGYYDVLLTLALNVLLTI